jgi:hypothetical protein
MTKTDSYFVNLGHAIILKFDYNGTEINTNIQYQYLHAHDKMMDVTQ